MEDAVNLYTSLIPGSRIVEISRNGEIAFTATFELGGGEYMALQGGPDFKFNESFSILVRCGDQAEVDKYWDALTADGGEESMCGWLKDRWGLSWQIIPDALAEALSDPDPARAQRSMEAMLQMRKIDVAAIENARAG
jgi:predicted 3-demethylubiquinone-9 3-methyltransferase (glyoxalase superfamily)